ALPRRGRREPGLDDRPRRDDAGPVGAPRARHSARLRHRRTSDGDGGDLPGTAGSRSGRRADGGARMSPARLADELLMATADPARLCTLLRNDIAGMDAAVREQAMAEVATRASTGSSLPQRARLFQVREAL